MSSAHLGELGHMSVGEVTVLLKMAGGGLLVLGKMGSWAVCCQSSLELLGTTFITDGTRDSDGCRAAPFAQD